ncbi:hypothetical protein [Paenibacillus monticola]|uniref:Uncharacterized protein n=1 Tax=Paenibacillus monticola TaxID=2666075 RepID=A0A7X2H7Z7_9BACL|nr:hypothetical protein [Paenibacillus monticola]MRN55229.1 hypothetical protein [Paenibacillus monticola]
MSVENKARIWRALKALRAQRVILLRRLAEINENLRCLPLGSRARQEVLEARVSIKRALRLNEIAIKNLRRSC